MTFAAWVLKLMMALAVTENVSPPEDLATAIANVALLTPLAGENGAEHEAAVLVAIAWNESRFRIDAKGDCKDPKTHQPIVGLADPRRTIANCASLGPFQIGKGWARPTPDLEGEAELAGRLVRESFRVCGSRPLAERLAFYAAGGAGCQERGIAASRWRMHVAAQLLKQLPPPPGARQP